jgi:C4-type Zn-finger protein
MADEKEAMECPMCGEKMRRHEREIVDVIPGTSEMKRHMAIEWICPECDYFEEEEESGKQ